MSHKTQMIIITALCIIAFLFGWYLTSLSKTPENVPNYAKELTEANRNLSTYKNTLLVNNNAIANLKRHIEYLTTKMGVIYINIGKIDTLYKYLPRYQWQVRVDSISNEYLKSKL